MSLNYSYRDQPGQPPLLLRDGWNGSCGSRWNTGMTVSLLHDGIQVHAGQSCLARW